MPPAAPAVPAIQIQAKGAPSRALVVVPEATRFSNRQREMGTTIRGGRGSRGGRRGRGGRGAVQPRIGTIPTFTLNFPFVEYTDEELISLFEDSGFFLGTSPESKSIVINYLRGLNKDRFDSVITDIVELSKESSGTVDIRARVMLENDSGSI